MHPSSVGSVVIPIIHCDLKFSSVCSLEVCTVILALPIHPRSVRLTLVHDIPLQSRVSGRWIDMISRNRVKTKNHVTPRTPLLEAGLSSKYPCHTTTLYFKNLNSASYYDTKLRCRRETHLPVPVVHNIYLSR